VSFGTAEETPGKHFHFKISANYLVTSVDKNQLSIFGETPSEALSGQADVCLATDNGHHNQICL
jgi:hypothetical protein